MSEELLKNTKFKNEIASFYKEHKEEILDIILFGSSIRNKEKPSDIDLLILFKNKKNIDVSYELKKNLNNYGENIEIIDKTYSELLDGSFKAAEGILSEGFSLIYNQFLSEGFGYNNFTLFRYKLKNLNKSKRMMFYYSLYGRGQKGILKELEAIKFSDTILLCPIKNTENMKQYLQEWDVDFLEFPALIPIRLKAVL